MKKRREREREGEKGGGWRPWWDGYYLMEGHRGNK